LKILRNMAGYGRFFRFALVGGGVAVIGGILLFCLTDLARIEPNLAYLMQAFVALQLNFILNDRLTWSDRKQFGFWQKWWRFHATKIVAIIFNQIFFGLLVLGGVPAIVAYIVCTVIVMVFNFFANDRLVYV
jgi:putative flippase GtrA